MSLSDEDLITQHKISELTTTVLISRYAKLIWKMAHARTNPSIEAEDLMQEGLMGLLNALGTFNPTQGAKFSTYANVCITNKMITALIKSNQHEIPIGSNINDLDKESHEISPESIILEREKMQELYDEIINLLSDKEWTIFRLFLTGSTYDQMARQLNIPLKVVDNAMQRVRRKLKSVWRADNFID